MSTATLRIALNGARTETSTGVRSNSLREQLSDAKADVADGFRAEAFFKLSQDFDLRNLFELVVQRWLEHTDVEKFVAQRHRRRVRGDEFADNL